MPRISPPSRPEPVDLTPESKRGPYGTHAEPSATDAVEHVIHAGQRLVSEGIELVTLDAKELDAKEVVAIVGGANVVIGGRLTALALARAGHPHPASEEGHLARCRSAVVNRVDGTSQGVEERPAL
jgi:hypothetical protein